jgi:hypothetical protein
VVGDAGLAAVTFDELAALVRQEMDGGYETEKQEGRRRLLQVIEELAAVPEETDHLLVGRTWRITKVHVAGVGGIETLTPGPLTLVPTSGVTVVRGPNGHGKTSLARAIDCGLRGDRDLPDEAAGELWAADLLTEGVAAAAIELTLVSGSDRLIIQATFGRTGPPAADATLIDDRGARLVDIGEPWRRALLSGRACYSYGALQNRLTENKALQGYLEELLILGPAWERVRKEITVRADRTTQAQKAVDTARRAAVHEEAALAARFAADTPACRRHRLLSRGRKPGTGSTSTGGYATPGSTAPRHRAASGSTPVTRPASLSSLGRSRRPTTRSPSPNGYWKRAALPPPCTSNRSWTSTSWTTAPARYAARQPTGEHTPGSSPRVSRTGGRPPTRHGQQ